MTLRATGRTWLFVLCLSACGGDGKGSGEEPARDGTAPCTDSVDPSQGFLPCDVEAVLKAKCQRCHDTVEALQPCLANDSCAPGPFPLLTFADTRRVLGERSVHERMAEVVESGAMPFQLSSIQPPVEPLTEAEKRVLLDWLGACAAPATTACPTP